MLGDCFPLLLLTKKAQLAVKFSKALSKPVTHVKISKADIVAMYKEAGLPEPVAELVVTMEDLTSQGVEERMNDVVEKVTGQKPKSFDDMIGENLGVW
ncbi:MAG: hypothetical protein Q9214_002087, partial [Letrouitia sp. 1 TL-2023]